MAFTRAKDRLFLSDAAGRNYDGTSRCPSRFLFNAERENLDYVVELDPDLIDEARNQIEKTESFAPRAEKKPDCVGKRVHHLIFGEGTVIGVPRDREGYIIQFDAIPTPRTLAPNGKLTFIE